LGIAGLLVVALIVMLLPHSAKVAINVVDSKGATVNHVDVFVDGKKECETAPCIVDVSAGAHEIKALSGNDSTTKAITVESRKDTTADLVLAGAGAGGTGIKVAGQPGIKLSVDGKDYGALPQEVKDLTPGDHKIKLSGDRYETLEKNVTVAKDEIQDLGTMTLKVTKGKATVTLGTPGARVYIVSGNDRRELPSLPIGVELDPTKAWTLNATKAGYQDYNQPISFADGQAEKSFDVELTPKSAAVSTFTPPATHNTTPSTPKPPRGTTSSNTSTETSSESSSASSGGGNGTLNINSLPAAAVVLDGKPLGQTPQLHISVDAGEHTVTFINSDQGLK
ncbi:MAG: PEGA domain-containing protein, partial [Polyangiaceae bacterium]